VYAGVSVEWTPGATPTAYFYDESGNEIEHATMGDLQEQEIEQFFINHNFPLRTEAEYKESAMVRKTWNGHTYELHPERNSFSVAAEFAATRTLNGEKGHLAAISSSEEQDFIDNLLIENDLLDAWLGGSDSDVEGIWKWPASGEEGKEGNVFWPNPDAFTNWVEGEPNNAGGSEHCIQTVAKKGWNDVNCATERYPLLIEFPIVMEDDSRDEL